MLVGKFQRKKCVRVLYQGNNHYIPLMSSGLDRAEHHPPSINLIRDYWRYTLMNVLSINEGLFWSQVNQKESVAPWVRDNINYKMPVKDSLDSLHEPEASNNFCSLKTFAVSWRTRRCETISHLRYYFGVASNHCRVRLS